MNIRISRNNYRMRGGVTRVIKIPLSLASDKLCKILSFFVSFLILASTILTNTVPVFAANDPTNVHVDDADSALTAYIGTGNYNNGDKATLNEKPASGRTFYGWLKNTSGTITDQTTNAGKTFTISHTAGATPTYLPNITKLITFNANGGTGTPTITSFNPNTGVTINGANGLSRYGYNLSSWTGTGASGTTITIPAGTHENRSYTANWTANSYNVTYSLPNNTVKITEYGNKRVFEDYATAQNYISGTGGSIGVTLPRYSFRSIEFNKENIESTTSTYDEVVYIVSSTGSTTKKYETRYNNPYPNLSSIYVYSKTSSGYPKWTSQNWGAVLTCSITPGTTVMNRAENHTIAFSIK